MTGKGKGRGGTSSDANPPPPPPAQREKRPGQARRSRETRRALLPAAQRAHTHTQARRCLPPASATAGVGGAVNSSPGLATDGPRRTAARRGLPPTQPPTLTGGAMRVVWPWGRGGSVYRGLQRRNPETPRQVPRADALWTPPSTAGVRSGRGKLGV